MTNEMAINSMINELERKIGILTKRNDELTVKVEFLARENATIKEMMSVQDLEFHKTLAKLGVLK